MVEKILDILKMILEKYLYKTLLSLAVAIIIYAKYSEIRLSKTESIAVVFILFFCFLRGIEIFYRYIKEKRKDAKEREMEAQEQIKYIKSELKHIKDIILNLPQSDKKILYEIVEEGNKVRTLKYIEYNGELLRLNYTPFGNMLYASVATKPFSEWIEIVKEYSDNNDFIYIDYKLDDDFFEILLAVQQMYGNSCFEYK